MLFTFFHSQSIFLHRTLVLYVCARISWLVGSGWCLFGVHGKHSPLLLWFLHLSSQAIDIYDPLLASKRQHLNINLLSKPLQHKRTHSLLCYYIEFLILC